MQSVRKSGATIQSGERDIIRLVIECCDKEYPDKVLSVPFNKATVSTATVKRICKADTIIPDERLNILGKTQKG